jgi:flagellar protein FlaJ
MLDKFFIIIGESALSLIYSVKNFSLKHENNADKEQNNEIIKKIFSRLNLEPENKTSQKEKNLLDKIRERLMESMFKKSTIILLAILAGILLIVSPAEIMGIFLTTIAMLYIFILYYHQIKNQRSYSDLNQELPYALRHMGIELKSGKGLHDTLITIKDADYGTFSKELNRVLEEVKFGKSTEDALLEMSKRVKSEGLARAVHQLIGTLRVGGNLANSLDIIAKDISFDMQIKLKEYSQKLNSFILIYTFIAILAPVISLIMLMASSTVMGDLISSNMLMLIYAVFFPMIVMFMGGFMKKLEPKI